MDRSNFKKHLLVGKRTGEIEVAYMITEDERETGEGAEDKGDGSRPDKSRETRRSHWESKKVRFFAEIKRSIRPSTTFQVGPGNLRIRNPISVL